MNQSKNSFTTKITEEPSSTIVIRNLSKNTNNEGLNNNFSEFGKILGIRIVHDPVTNISRGFGFIDFSDIESAKKSIQKRDGFELDGQTISVSYATPKPNNNLEQNPPNYSIMIRGLSPETTTEGLKNKFLECGEILNCKIMKRRGIGFVGI